MTSTCSPPIILVKSDNMVVVATTFHFCSSVAVSSATSPIVSFVVSPHPTNEKATIAPKHNKNALFFNISFLSLIHLSPLNIF